MDTPLAAYLPQDRRQALARAVGSKDIEGWALSDLGALAQEVGDPRAATILERASRCCGSERPESPMSRRGAHTWKTCPTTTRS